MTTSKETAFLGACCRSPYFWCQNLITDGARWGDRLSEVQRQDFAAMDPALLFVAGRAKKKPSIRRFWRQRSRGYSKTTDIAASAIWTFGFTQRVIEGLVAAEDREQANLLRDSIAGILQQNPWMTKFVDLQRNALKNKQNGSQLKFISSDTNSSYGERPDFVIMDEFTHWSDEEFYHSILSSYGKRDDAGAVLIIGCNAGHGQDWKWNVREAARKSPKWHFSAPLGWSPWYSEEMIEEQRSLLPENAFSRLFLNEWQDSGGGFVSTAEADACVDKELYKKSSPDPDVAYYVAALDYAEKVDRTVGVLGHLVGNEIIIDRMDVVDPTTHGRPMLDGSKSKMVPATWCEEWMTEMVRVFGSGEDESGRPRQVMFVVDEWQLKWLVQKYEAYWPIHRVRFAGGEGNYQIARVLRYMLLHKLVRWYPGCGQILDDDGNPVGKNGMRDDLASELGALTVKEMQGGRWRIEHHAGAHDDRAFALGALCHFIVDKSAAGTFEDL